MTRKPDFDPKKHLINGNSNEYFSDKSHRSNDSAHSTSKNDSSYDNNQWELQEDAFFGKGIGKGERTVNGDDHKVGSVYPNEENDLELARKLQEQMNKELEVQLKAENESLALARQMEQENQFRNQAKLGPTINHSVIRDRDKFQEERDAALARAIMQQETSLSVHGRASHMNTPQDDDLELARRMQEFENMGMGKLNSFKRPNAINEEAQVETRDQGFRKTSGTRSSNPPSLNSSLNAVDSNSSANDVGSNSSVNTAAKNKKDYAGSEHFQSPFDQINSKSPNLSDKNRKYKKGLMGTLRKLGLVNDEDGVTSHGGAANPNSKLPVSTPGPLAHSLSIKRIPPSTPLPAMASGYTSNKNSATGRAEKDLPICSVCGKVAYSYLQTLDKKYHADCFRCMGCHDMIDPSTSFAFTVGDDNEKHPLHRKCYAELYGIKCVVCKESIPTGADGKVSYVKHPFFDTDQMCPKHAINPGRRCTGCHRFEPIGNGFVDLEDANRCVCNSCCRTVIVDSNEAKPLWEKIIYFFEHELQIPVWSSMREIPVLVVGHDALNNSLGESAHSGSSQIMTRGLCLSEHQSGRRIALQSMKFDQKNRSFTPKSIENDGFTYFKVPDSSAANPNSSITAILCLSGLPSDLTASVLAHEATHAWFKLHPSFNISTPIPPMVEEGCCQLVAHLFLDNLDPASTEKHIDGGPSDEKLRQYFKFSIETDENEVYGEGYRQAAMAYSNIGILALLSHVLHYREFPKT